MVSIVPEQNRPPPRTPTDSFTPFERMMANAENAPLLEALSRPLSEDIRVFPHRSAEGGLDTSGFGHKFLTEEEQSRRRKLGASGRDTIDEFRSDLKHRGAVPARKFYDKVFGKGKFEELPEFGKEMLTTIQFNTSSGIAGFPKMLKAIANRDWVEALDQMHLDEEKIPGLKRRNDINRDFFLPKVIRALGQKPK